MIEDILATLHNEGFLVSNTFQLAPGPTNGRGAQEWQVYLRHSRDVRRGQGGGETMEAALRAAHRAAGVAPKAPDTASRPSPSPPTRLAEELTEELF